MEESSDNPGAREGAGRPGAGPAVRRSAPNYRRGCWRRGRPIRTRPAPVIGSGGRRGGEPGSLTLLSPESFPARAAGAASPFGAAGISPLGAAAER